MFIENTLENMLENCKYIDFIIGILTLNGKNTQTKSLLNYFMNKWQKNSSRRHIVTKKFFHETFITTPSQSVNRIFILRNEINQLYVSIISRL